MNAGGAVSPIHVARDESAPLGPEMPTPAAAAPPDDAPLGAFADELPPGFWEEVPDPPHRARQVTAADPDTPEADAGEAARRSRAVQHPEEDPRFRLLQSLFPGRLVAWQAHAPHSDSAEYSDGDLHSDAHDGLEDAETVD